MKIEARPTAVRGGGGSASSINGENLGASPQEKNRMGRHSGVSLEGAPEPVGTFEADTGQSPVSIDLETNGRNALALQAGRNFTDADWATKGSQLIEFVRILRDWDRKTTR
jgi:hypothetical protein